MKLKIALVLFLFKLTVINSNPVSFKTKAVGGVLVESPTSFPYQAAIFARYESSSSFCSGSILSKNFIVTSAHCINGSTSANIFYGTNSIRAVDFSRNQVIDKVNYKVHPSFTTFIDDIALIEMNFEIEFNEVVQPVMLPEPADTLHDGQSLLMASWGHYSGEGRLSDVLRTTDMEVISLAVCSTIFPPPLITSSVICTMETHCSGDSGSMLVDRNSEGKFVAVGIASFSYNSCDEESAKPSVFMRVTSYLDFINDNIDLNYK